MTQAARVLSHTFADYLAREAGSDSKHELVNGEIFAMAGGTVEHGRLAANVIGEREGGEVRLASIGCAVAVDAIYHDPLAPRAP